MKNTMEVHARKYHSKISYLEVNIPITSEEEFIEAFVNKLDSDPEINFTIIDHITSASALVLPVEQLIRECRKRNVIVCIDGAHAPGQLELNLEVLRPDFYVGNLHKWCYAVRGTALMWVHPDYHNIIEPLITSHEYKKSIQKKFFDQGTDEMTNYIVIPTALDYFEKIGGQKFLRNHANGLLESLRVRLCNDLNCSMYPVPIAMQAPYMKIVKLPDSVRYLKSWKGADQLWSDLNSRFKLSVYISYANEALWVGISNIFENQKPYVFTKNPMFFLDPFFTKNKN